MRKAINAAVVTALISIGLSLLVLYTPSPKMDEHRFSSIRALAHIETISREPHSVFDADAHEQVRQYIKDTLAGYLGPANVREYNYPREALGANVVGQIESRLGKPVDFGIRNVLGVIPGKSDTAIMLVGHYDSRGHIGRHGELGRSYGAADDGYAIGTMLEIASLYRGRNLENTVYLLFTDAEEIGLHGARLASRETDLMDRVGFLINMEARGIRGAAYMFETSPQNKNVIEFYRKASLPVSYSLATAIYRMMPNATDFTPFLATGVNGINLAVLAGLDHYHSPRDHFSEVSASSLQHYGDQVAPLVEAFVSDPRYSDAGYFDADAESVFFTLFPNVFISYPEVRAKALHVAAFIMLIALVYFMARNGRAAFRKLGSFTLGLFLAVILAAMASLAFGYLMALIGRSPYSIIYVRMNGSGWPTLLFILALSAVFYTWQRRTAVTEEEQRAFLLLGISLHLAVALATGFTLPGASFLFFVPALAGIAALAASLQVHSAVKHAAYGLATLVCLLLVVPILYSLFLALTVGGTPILSVLLLVHLAVLVPVFQLHMALSQSHPLATS